MFGLKKKEPEASEGEEPEASEGKASDGSGTGFFKALDSKVEEWSRKSSMVKLHTVEFVAYEGRYVDTVETMERKDLPVTALPISGRNREYFNPSRLMIPKVEPKDPTASDLYLFATNSSLTDAMVATGRHKTPMDVKQIVIYLFIAIVGFCVLYALIL